MTVLTWTFSLLCLPVIVTAASVSVPQGSRVDSASNSDSNSYLTSSVELSPETLPVTTASGWWWIKFFSPYCMHCKKLAPLWDAIANDHAAFLHSHNFSFAHLDCVHYGGLHTFWDILTQDYCSELNITSYPTLKLCSSSLFPYAYQSYHNSRFVEEFPFELPRNQENLLQFIQEHLDTPIPNQQSSSESSDSHDSALPKKPLLPDLPQSPPNSLGKSVSLTQDTFISLVSGSKDGWFIKLYVPWCAHCSAMNEAWTDVAKEMKGLLNIGEINCDVEKKLCKDVNPRGYPTLMFFKNNNSVEYDGLRSLGDLLAFSREAIHAAVHEVDVPEFEDYESKSEVVFLYFYDHATTSEDFDALEKTCLSLIRRAPLLKTKSETLVSRFRVTSFPSLVVIRDGSPSYYPALSPKDLRDYRRMLAWMKTVWTPLLPELSSANSNEIMQNHLVVLAALDKASPNFEAAKKELKATALEWLDVRAAEEKAERQEQRDKKAKQVLDAEAKGNKKAIAKANDIQVVLKPKQDVGFAWVDGAFWNRWLQTTYGIHVKELGMQVVINDQDKHRYWDTTVSGGPIAIDKATIIDTVQVILSSPKKIKPKMMKNRFENAIYAAGELSHNHPLLTIIFLLSTISLLMAFFRGKFKGLQQNLVAFLANPPKGKSGANGGLLGGTTTGKYD